MKVCRISSGCAMAPADAAITRARSPTMAALKRAWTVASATPSAASAKMRLHVKCNRPDFWAGATQLFKLILIYEQTRHLSSHHHLDCVQ